MQDAVAQSQPETTVKTPVTRNDHPIRIGVLTSGGDAPGMNAAVRAVVRTALNYGAQPYAIMEGWYGAVQGGDAIKEMHWKDVSGILSRGGTAIGTARCPEFRDYEGRHAAARNLIEKGIDHLVVIGGDGSLSGTDEFRSEWAQHLSELVKDNVISQERADASPELVVTGLVGSIDNDLVGTDMTIGADTALTRIITAMDEIKSTAASHQRTFILEVMGRHCGYLPLMAAVAGGADYVFTPEDPAGPGWEDQMCQKLQQGRDAGRRESIIVVAEGARDRDGKPLTAQRIADEYRERTGMDPRITILGHVQRGGTPSAYDRWMPTLLGFAAVQTLMEWKPGDEASILGVRNNRVTRIPMMDAIRKTRAVKNLLKDGDFEAAQKARGASFQEMVQINRMLSQTPEFAADPNRPRRVAIIHCGGLAPGMNTAARAAVRLGIARGWTMLGIEGSWNGLVDNRVKELSWSAVEGWGFDGGAELGTRRRIPTVEQYYALGRALERNQIDALLVIGGMNAYLSVEQMTAERDRYPAFRIPTILVPASIDNNLPGSELSIGADTALNNALISLDRIKESAAASKRCFVAELMGRACGYLTLMSGIASGAELVYLNEDPYTLADIDQDAQMMHRMFKNGRRLLLALINEEASPNYDRDFLATVFRAESQGLFDVRDSALGHMQQGGAPSSFDRLLATRLVARAIVLIDEQLEKQTSDALYIGQTGSAFEARPVSQMAHDLDHTVRRPYEQWWLALKPVLTAVAIKDEEKLPEYIPIATAAGSGSDSGAASGSRSGLPQAAQ